MAHASISDAKSDSAGTVAVVIPTLNRDDLLEPCLEHLQRQTFRRFRVLIIDNGRRFTRPPMLDRFDNLRWIPMGENRGTSAAFNRGIAESDGCEYVFLLNNDAELEPDCLARLVETLENDQGYSMAVPKLVQWSNPRLLDGVGDEMLLGGAAYRVGNGDLDAGQYDRPQPVLSACGAAALYRRNLFADIGEFDEDFFAYCEDVDLGLRAQLRGRRCVYVPGARVRHRGSATTGDTFHPKIMRLTTRNRLFVIVKNYPGSVLVRLLPRIIVFHGLWLAFALRKRAFFASCKGFVAAIFLLPKVWIKRRAIQSSRTVNQEAFLAILRESEARVWSWHANDHSARQGRLLGVYFRLFPVRAEAGGLRATQDDRVR